MGPKVEEEAEPEPPEPFEYIEDWKLLQALGKPPQSGE
jgi:hypothetical protein